MTVAAPLAITMGEPAGIGGELSLKAWSMRRQGDRPFFVLDDASRLAALAGKLGLNVPVREVDRPAEAEHVFATALPVLPVRLRAPVRRTSPEPNRWSLMTGFHGPPAPERTSTFPSTTSTVATAPGGRAFVAA